MKYLPIIGLEIHVELRTKSKMFCGCPAYHFQVLPNTHTCPVCLGLPGALPVPNQKAIDWCLLIGLALNCEIQNEARFDRKNYFYPDLPKGYQISQYDLPFCRNGQLKIELDDQKTKVVRINRVHLEEDTGKLVHTFINGEKMTLIDFNRSGVPLVEIVSEPEINSPEEAVSYLKKIQQIIRYLEVSDCDMEKGSMRLEVNISLASPLTTKASPLPKYKVEVKNINSFRFVAKAINYEIQRQKMLIDKGKIPIQETRGFDEKIGKTYSQRQKEESHDYRYFPEPDIPPFIDLKVKSEKLKRILPELPEEKIKRFIKDYGLLATNAKILANDKKVAAYFEESVKILQKAKSKRQTVKLTEIKQKIKDITNMIINKKIDPRQTQPAQLVAMLLHKAYQNQPNQKVLLLLIKRILSDNAQAVNDYQGGKKTALEFLVGQVMRELKGKGNPLIIKKLIEKLMEVSKP